MVIDNIISRFFTGKSFRVFRHIFLLLLLTVITISFLWYVPVVNVPGYYKIYAWIVYFTTFTGIIYHNLYFAVPGMLLKNKMSKYTLTLVVYIIITFLCIIFVQYYLLRINWSGDHNLNIILTNMLSVVLVLCFLFLGTTSFLLVKYHIVSDMEKSELESSILELELKQLKSQINPHFLFNMLNNVNMLLIKDNKQASEVLFKLEDLLRYQINDNIKENVSLESDINFLNDYLNLEKIRRDNFDYSITRSANCGKLKVAPLLFIVFVENAVKHNVDNEASSFVNISFKCFGSELEFICENSKSEQITKDHKIGGLGLKNISRRLDLLYPQRHKLDIKDEELKYTVKLTLIL